jgi:hypothetical protein
VLRRCRAGRAVDDPDGQRDAGFPAAHVAGLGRLVHDLVHGHGHKIGKHNLGNRPHADQGRAEPGPDDGLFRDGRIPHPLRAKLFVQAGADAKYAAKQADVFTH